MMLTRCPTCSTAFRVTPEQLKVRAGKVRCGHCKAVFNALESLEDAPPVAEAAPPPSESEPVPAAAIEEAPAVESPAADAAMPENAPPEPSAVETGAVTVEAGAVDILLEDIQATEVPPPAPRRGWYAWAAAGLLERVAATGMAGRVGP